MREEDTNTRIFIIHNKTISEETLRNYFGKFGFMKDVWLVKNKATGEPRGVTYVTYNKMYEAACAVEEMNGITIENDTRPLKVVFANNREEGSTRDEGESRRFMRIFVVCGKGDDVTEESLKEYFCQFGDVEDVLILKDRDTNKNKGFAFIQFYKASHAAKALEECDAKFKAVIARPREKDQPKSYEMTKYEKTIKEYNYARDGASKRMGAMPPKDRSYGRGGGYDSEYSSYGPARLKAFVSSVLDIQYANRLFDLFPGFVRAAYNESVSHRTQSITVEYETGEQAEFAAYKLNNFEYPIGEPIMIQAERGFAGGDMRLQGRKRKFDEFGGEGGEGDIREKMMRLTEALAEANQIINAAGLTTGSAANFCSADLPPIKPMVKNQEGRFRLFLVFQPEAPPQSALKDVFCRFGNLVEVYTLPNKTFGYACYADATSANRAIETLHGHELYGNRMKVIEAEPQPAKRY